MAADRGAYIDQSQSLNIHIAKPNYGIMTSMHVYGWKKGLKTGMYYLRTKPAADPIQFTVDKSKLIVKEESKQVTSLANGKETAHNGDAESINGDAEVINGSMEMIDKIDDDEELIIANGH